MAPTFDLGDYACTDPPPTLWRVTHSGSQSHNDRATGDIVAADSTSTISNIWDLKQAAEEHFDWYSRETSCFLSTFSCVRHARGWANLHERDVSIREIDTTMLPDGVLVFDAKALAARLGIHHPHSKDEFLFLHRIPSVCLEPEPEPVRDQAYIDEKEVRYSVHDLDGRHDSDEESEDEEPDPDGGYDSDEESEGREPVDDITRLLEDLGLI